MVALSPDDVGSGAAASEEELRLLKFALEQHEQFISEITASFERLRAAQSFPGEDLAVVSNVPPDQQEPQDSSWPLAPIDFDTDETSSIRPASLAKEASNKIRKSRTTASQDWDCGRRPSQRSHGSRTTRKVPTVGMLLAEPNLVLSPIQRCVQIIINYGGALVVLLNSMVLLFQLEMEGRTVAFDLKLGLNEGQDFNEVLPSFRVIDSIFIFIFLGELLLRVAVERLDWLKDLANWLDFVMVVAGLVDFFFYVQAESADSVTLRFITVMKAFRAIRMVRSFRFFRGLRMLVKACQCCLPSLCWSMLLLAVFMCMGGLILGNLLQNFIKDESQNFEDRRWIWERYGTASRATWTLYEITFAGNWPQNVRPVLEKVSQGFIVFYLLYITIIVFAVIRVISALFLRDTLEEANNDAHHMVLEKLRKKNEYVDKLAGIFRTIETDGMITEEKFTEILQNPKVKAYFQTLEIDVQEGAALFHLLDNGEGAVTFEEFIDGIMRCKGPARAIDTVALHADLKSLEVKLSVMEKMLRQSTGTVEDQKLRRPSSHNHAEQMLAFRNERFDAPILGMTRQVSPA
ncbi:unnamed protein product [Durusdinium trenchii]|uniref:Cation channel sperm-associated protein 1 (CatSper1) n=2 Tax=Durusdinium trenchii TaxID=1381693 RepID=A0ABP0IQG5_9DINO